MLRQDKRQRWKSRFFNDGKVNKYYFQQLKDDLFSKLMQKSTDRFFLPSNQKGIPSDGDKFPLNWKGIPQNRLWLAKEVVSCGVAFFCVGNLAWIKF